MIITRLSWAGLQISAEEFTLFIDPLENIAPLAGFLGQPRTELLPIASVESKSNSQTAKYGGGEPCGMPVRPCETVAPRKALLSLCMLAGICVST